MKLMRLAMCVAVFAVVGGIAISEDMDVRALQAKLAAQEARLNDLQAKMYGANCEGDVADGITSLRKNAVVTLGGTVNTRYFYRQGSVKSSLPTGTMTKVADSKAGDLRIADAKLEAKIDVNDYFDAYLKLDFQDTDRDWSSGIAQNYWVRWKNICNSGFGVLVGRDDLKYGMGPSVGILDSFSAGNGGTFTDNHGGAGSIGPFGFTDDMGQGMFVASNGGIPTHSGWDYSRTTQITPYWENCDGSFKAELSFIQSIDTRNGVGEWSDRTTGQRTKYRSVNYGVGSMTGRITWKPIEDLKLVASAMNLHAKQRGGLWQNPTAGNNPWNNNPGFETSDNNLAASFGFEYNPCFLNKRLTLWGYYQHGWNEGWVKDMDSDLINAGIKFDLTDQLYVFAQGDYIYVKNDNADLWHKAKGYAAYAGFGYTLPYGVNFEAGYRHDKVDYKNDAGQKHTKWKSDTVYAHLGFNF